jgi:hypothetical protein
MPEQKNDIMKYDNVLPEDFDGVFMFTNWSDEDFKGVWGSVEYMFPALTTSPMVMPFSPVEIQNIRKKFAKDLAEREYFKSKHYASLQKQEGTPGNRTMNSIHQAGTYTMNELTPFIQKALDPLPVAKAEVRRVGRPSLEKSISRGTAAIKTDGDLERLAKEDKEE